MTPLPSPPPGPGSSVRDLFSLSFSILLLLGSLAPPSALCLDFGYHDNVALHSYLLNVTKSYPDITHLHSIGKSVNGADLWVIKIGKSPVDHVTLRPNIKYVANMHGNEVVGRELLLHLVEMLVTRYGQDDDVTHLLNTTTVHLLPSMNPDGFAASDSTDCDGVQGRFNARNLDLNRNFPDHFQENLAIIQPETHAIVKWIRDTQFVLSANLHGGSLVANYPFDSYPGVMIESKASLSPDNDVFVHLAKAYSFAHATMHNVAKCSADRRAFQDGITNGAAWYPLKGGMQDYNYVRSSCYELTLELSCCKYPPASELPTFWNQNKPALLKFLQQVHMGVKGIVTDENNNGVRDAIIEVEGREGVPFRSSEYGEYWKLLLPGFYKLLVAKSGYDTEVIPFEVKENVVTRLDAMLKLTDSAGRGNNLLSVSTSGLLLLGLVSLKLSAQ
ncbi:hypothetical protein V1264_021356 [Littorina saxatilis]|uniref:Peptidase M14 domain-containing protein n=1 Tax=Littorina saxatilis TaxID=31220 RepID=A0AAN9AI09_9CAEN